MVVSTSRLIAVVAHVLVVVLRSSLLDEGITQLKKMENSQGGVRSHAPCVHVQSKTASLRTQFQFSILGSMENSQ
jgi:hypothetical protein